MKEIILLKNGEIVLKGLNKSSFEDVLIKNAHRRLEPLGRFRFTKAQSTIYVFPEGEGIDLDEAVERLQTVFGVARLCRACIVDKDFADIKAKAVQYLGDHLRGVRTFKVEAKRSDKAFPMNSPELCRELGGFLLEQFPHLEVDVHTPQLTVMVEIREFAAFLHVDQLLGAGGIPVGTGGKAALLLSGGIDSPVAGFMMAKRGLELIAVHFASPPYTGDRARHKVELLAKKLTRYCGRIFLFIVPFTEIQEAIRDQCPEDFFTLVMRRVMMRAAEAIALREGCGGLITGESVGQVASQTLWALGCTDIVTELPVFRPVIGMDKEEIVAVARKIDTFETSILPYEDCCTVFTPRHPKTKPKAADLLAIEAGMPGLEAMTAKAAEQAELVVLRQNGPAAPEE